MYKSGWEGRWGAVWGFGVPKGKGELIILPAFAAYTVTPILLQNLIILKIED